MVRAVNWISTLCFLAAIGLVAAALPIGDLIEALRIRIEGFGYWAPTVFAVAYGLAATLFIPGSAMSLAAGVVFGPWLGTAVVWSGANIAIILSFLIARYAARRRVEALAASRPRFAAIDSAIGDLGWKIVALVRLSPIFPFSLQNYLFGVTAIRFLPCATVSAIFILPGTFLYVYLGFVGGEAASVASGGPHADLLRIALQILGLIATVVATVWIAKIASKAIASHTPPEPRPAAHTSPTASGASHSHTALLVLLAAILLLIAAAMLYRNREALNSRFSRPEHSIPTSTARGPNHSNDWLMHADVE